MSTSSSRLIATEITCKGAELSVIPSAMERFLSSSALENPQSNTANICWPSLNVCANASMTGITLVALKWLVEFSLAWSFIRAPLGIHHVVIVFSVSTAKTSMVRSQYGLR